MIVVTENFSGQWLSLRPPWRARRQFVVTGTTDMVAALAAVDAVDPTIKVPQRYDLYRDGSPLICVGPEVAEVKGPDNWVINADYEVNVSTATTTSDLLLQPPKYRWENVDMSEPSQVDLDGNLIQNAAGSLFQPMSRPIACKRVYVTRYAPHYDAANAAAFENGVNDTPLVFAGLPVAKEYMRCVSILPAVEYDLVTATRLPITHIFDIIFDTALGPHPWQAVYPNCGDTGWYDKSGTKNSSKFVNQDGDEVGREVRLSVGGNLHTSEPASVKVGPTKATPLNSPISYTYYKYLADASLGDRVVFKKMRLVSMTAIGL